MPAEANCCRVRETSLVTITKKFMEFKDRCGRVVNLKDAAAVLRVPKRRLYDVVNVLQGVGLMERVQRNAVAWESLAENSDLLRSLQCEHDALLKEEALLDSVIQKLVAVVGNARNEVTAYVRIRDLRSMEGLAGQTLVAMTSLPDEMSSVFMGCSAESGRFEVLVKTDGCSQLRGFLCPANSFLLTDMMELAMRGGDPSPRHGLGGGSPSAVIKQEEISFENEVLDCILEALLNSSSQHNDSKLFDDLFPTPISVKNDGFVGGSEVEDSKLF